MTSDARPLARDDLDVAARVIDDETLYFIGDPVRNEYKQLDELQYEVFSRLDGVRTVGEISKELLETFEVEVSTSDLSEFISGLGEMNLLDPASDLGTRSPIDPEQGKLILQRLESEGVVFARRSHAGLHLPPRGTERRRRHDEAAMFDAALAHLERGDLRETSKYLRSVLEINKRNHRARHLLHAVLGAHVGKKVDFESVFFFRVPIVNPERFLGRIDRLVGSVVFTRAFLLFWFLLVGSAFVVLLSDLPRLATDFRYALSFNWVVAHPIALPVIWVFGVFSVASHEVAHGVTCRHFGGRVREMGVLFAYLTAGAYCDISSSYLIQDRWQRALISLAGVMWNLSVWALAVGIWAVVRTDTTLGILSFLVVINLVGYLAQWNPVIRTDGYLALTDLLNYPNLRDDAFTYLRLRLDQLILRSGIDIPPELEARRRLYLWYAVPGVIGTLLFIGTGFYLIAGTLIDQLHTFGVLLSAFILYSILWSFVWDMTKSVWAQRQRLWRSQRFRKVTIATLLMLAAIVVMPWPLRIYASCLTLPTIDAVRSPYRGIVERYLVEHGARVEKGAPIAQLSSEALEVTLARSRAELRSAELDLEKLRKRVRDEELGVAKARLAGERAVLAASERSVARLRRLAEDQLVQRDQLDAVVALREKARSRVSDASENMQALTADALAAEILAGEALVKMLRAQATADERRLAAATVKSPSTGLVLLPQGRPAAELAGTIVDEGEAVVRVRRVGGEQLELHLPLTAPLGQLGPGARVEARLHGMSDVKLRGELVKLGATFELSERAGTLTQAVMRAEVSLDDETLTLGLPAGLSGEAYATAGWFPLGAHAYLRLVRLIKVDIDQALSALD